MAPPQAAEPVTVPEPPTAEELTEKQHSTWRKRLGKFLAPIALIAAKLKAILLVLLKLKFVVTLGSMVVSIAAYAIVFGWPFAVGFVLLLFIHEMGHVIQLRREGIEASAPFFIPFLGALIKAHSFGKDAAAEARVGLAGPILGSLASLVPLALWLSTGNDIWRALAYVGFFINLFNLIPVLPLDGGRAMAALSPKLWLVGVVLACVLAVLYFGIFILLIIGAIGGSELYHRWKQRNSPGSKAYHSVPLRTRFIVAGVYFALAAALMVGTMETFVPRHL